MHFQSKSLAFVQTLLQTCFIYELKKKLPSFLGCIIGAYSHHAIDYFWYDWGTHGIY